MGVDPVLKKRRLTPLGLVADRSDLFMYDCESSTLPMLSQVEPFGTLILTPPAMPHSLSEIDETRHASFTDRQHVAPPRSAPSRVPGKRSSQARSQSTTRFW